MFELRNYQRDALDAQYAYWGEGGGNSLIVLPTGSGKSLVMAALCQEVLRHYPTMRIAVATHVRELIAQDYDELKALWPGAPAGIYSAGLKRRDAKAQILFCGIQSVWDRLDEIGPVDLLLVDEAHLIPRNASTLYQKFITALWLQTPDMRIVGLTATPYRIDSGRLDQGEDRLFETVVYEANLRQLIDDKYLCPLITKATLQKMAVQGVGLRGGDFIPSALEIAVNRDWITHNAVDEIVTYGHDRRGWLVFCVGVEHARNVAREIKGRGVSCETITGEMSERERDARIAAFRAGSTQCLVSVMVLGTGFNVPHVDLIALLRPTMSPGLFVQQVGRGLRNAEGKENCLVLDFASNTQRHGPIDLITGQRRARRDEEDGAPLVKECPECRSLAALAAMNCPTCGYAWPNLPAPPHAPIADANNDILASLAPEWIPVEDVSYHRHVKLGKPPSLRVTYHCGLVRHSQWICLEHDGYAREKAKRWWMQNAWAPVPVTVAEALARRHEIRTPTDILVRREGKYFQIVALSHKEFGYG
jgi:DNA repair protein RadD